MSRYLIAHDVGTSGDKAVLVDLDGGVLGKASRPYPTHYPGPDRAEQDAEDWWAAVAGATRELLAGTGVSPGDVAAVTFSSQLLGIVPHSAAGEVLRRPIIWLDSRATAEARTVMRRFGGRRIFGLVAGAEIGGKDGIPKLLWLRNHEPDVWGRMRCFLDVGGTMLYRCTGRMAMDWSGASAFGFDLGRKKWLGLLSYAGVDPAKLPSLVRSTDVVGPLTRDAAEHLGLLAGTPVVAGCGDAQAAAVGSGVVRAGEGHLCIGTSGWLNVLMRGAHRGHHGMAVIQSADPEHSMLFAEMETAGACAQWLADQVFRAQTEHGGREEAYRLMDDAAEKVRPGADGLLFTPWMYGERVPMHDAAIRSAFLGLSVGHSREHLVRAVYEGVCYQMRWIVETAEKDFGLRLPALRCIGGGAQSVPWMQILADVTRRPVEIMRDPVDAGAVGAALTAAVGLGIHPSFESLSALRTPDRTISPGVDADGYDRLYHAFTRTYPRLHRLGRLLGSDRRASAEALGSEAIRL